MPLVPPSRDEAPASLRGAAGVLVLAALSAFALAWSAHILCGVAAAVLIGLRWIPLRWQPRGWLARWAPGILAAPFLVILLNGLISEGQSFLWQSPDWIGRFLVCLLMMLLLQGVHERRHLGIVVVAFAVLLMAGGKRWGDRNWLYLVHAIPFGVVLLWMLRTLAAAGYRRGPAKDLPSAPRRWPRWSFGSLLFLAAGMAWALASWLPGAQRRVDSWMAGGGASSHLATGFTWNTRLGQMGRMLQSDQPVLRVFTQRARPMRGRVLPVYDGQGWTSHSETNEKFFGVSAAEVSPAIRSALDAGEGGYFEISPSADAPPRTEPLRTARVVVDPPGVPVLFAPYLASGVRSDITVVFVDGRGCLYHRTRTVGVEYWIAFRETPDVSVPEGSGPELSAEDRAPYLQVPEELQPRFLRLAEDWCSPRARGDALEAADRLAGCLRVECKYSLHLTRGDPREDPVLDFLCNTRSGQCEYFASAMVLLLRALGHPARYVTGFAVSEWNSSGGYFLVRERDAHAWAEVFAPGRGWVTVDATPASVTASRESPSAWAAWRDRWSLLWTQVGIWLEQRTWGDRLADGLDMLLAWGRRLWWLWCLLLLPAAAGILWRRGRRALAAAAKEEVVAVGAAESESIRMLRRGLDRLAEALARWDLRRNPAETLEEFGRRVTEGPLDAIRSGEVRGILDRYAVWRYGPREADLEAGHAFDRDVTDLVEHLETAAAAGASGAGRARP